MNIYKSIFAVSTEARKEGGKAQRKNQDKVSGHDAIFYIYNTYSLAITRNILKAQFYRTALIKTLRKSKEKRA